LCFAFSARKTLDGVDTIAVFGGNTGAGDVRGVFTLAEPFAQERVFAHDRDTAIIVRIGFAAIFLLAGLAASTVLV
tara:strand:+ start:8354 stop:8581 length:228 start_codon:yes stop_codon:yes gene_type:complete